jgi:hypothetical protein
LLEQASRALDNADAPLLHAVREADADLDNAYS